MEIEEIVTEETDLEDDQGHPVIVAHVANTRTIRIRLVEDTGSEKEKSDTRTDEVVEEVEETENGTETVVLEGVILAETMEAQEETATSLMIGGVAAAAEVAEIETLPDKKGGAQVLPKSPRSQHRT